MPAAPDDRADAPDERADAADPSSVGGAPAGAHEMGDASASPEGALSWPQAWGPRHPARNTRMLGLGIALLVVAVAIAAGGAGAPGPLWSGVFLALFGLTALAVWARAPFGRGRFRMINAVTLTRARVRPPDSWVHFVRERRTGLPLLLVTAVWTVVFAVVAALAVVIGVNGRPQAFLGAVVLGVFAVLFGYGAVRGTIAQYRLDSFGRRPVGLSVGPSGLAVLRVSDPVYVPWDAIRSVTADASAPRRGSGRAVDQPTPLLRLHVDRRRVRTASGDAVSSTVTLSPAALRLDPQVLWTVIQACVRPGPERAQLGTTAGRQMLDRWCAAAR